MQKQNLLNSLKQKGFPRNILEAFSKVPRENFIPDNLKPHAYDDIALPIGQGQTISQPYTIAMMLDLMDLKKGQKVLEVGSGCGYVLALLSEMVGAEGNVFGIEIIKELAEQSKENLKDCKNVEVYNQNGKEGLKEHAPYDRILISAACGKIPDKLKEQLKNNGIIVAPVDSYGGQDLVAVQKDGNELIEKKRVEGFRFVRFV